MNPLPFSEEEVLRIIVRASAMALRDYRKPVSKFKTKESFRDLVTATDMRIEKFLVKHLGRLTPGCGWILEEANLKDAIQKEGWIIDPLDGTVNFVHRFPVFGISAAWSQNGRIRWGAVAHPCDGSVYWASRGKGAFIRKNGKDQRLRVSSVSNLAQSLVEVGFADVRSGIRPHTLPVLASIIMGCHGVRRLGAAALDLCFVARGWIDGYYEKHLNPWDVAAGGLIVEEAGGCVTDFSNGVDWLYGRSIAASNGKIHSALLRLIQTVMKPQTPPR